MATVIAGLAQIHPHVVTALDELAGDVGADEAAGAHHEDLRRRAGSGVTTPSSAAGGE